MSRYILVCILLVSETEICLNHILKLAATETIITYRSIADTA